MPKEKCLMNPCFLSKNTCTISSSSSVSSVPAAFLCLSLSESMLESTVDSAEAMIMKWNPDSPMGAKFTSMFYENKREALEFIKLVRDLQNAMYLLISRNSASKILGQAQSLMIIAMKRLQKEFRQILLCTNQAESVSSSSPFPSRASMRSSTSFDDDDDRVAVESISNAYGLSSIAMADLKAIAECMISAGYGKECLQIYKSTRKSMMEEEIFLLGVEKLSSSLINKLDWDVLEIRIKHWEKAVKKTMNNLFVSERILSDHIFEMSDPFGKSCFSEITKDSAMLLFSFAELVAKKKKTQEKLFIMLSIYRILSENMPKIETMFSGDFADVIRSQARTSLNLVSASVRSLLSEFQSSIEESTKSPVAGGGVHNLTLHVMSYLSPLGDFNRELTAIFADFPQQSEKSSILKSYFDRLRSDESPPSTIFTRIAWLIIVLFSKLHSKAKHYSDISLSNLFLANNFHYVVSIIRTSKLKDILGGDWITEHEAKVKKFVEKYERSAWDPVFASLPENPNATIPATRATEIFGNFGHVFEETCRKECDNVVTDPKLQEEIKQSISRKLIPIYRQFYHTHRARVLGDRRKVGLNVKFAPEDVENYLSDLFSGPKEPTLTPSSSPTASPSLRKRRTFRRRQPVASSH